MKKMKYTIPGQMASVVSTHAVTAFIFFFIWLIMAGMWEGVAGTILSCVGCVSYFISIYNSGVICAQNDKRSISPLEAYPQKGLILPAILLAVNIIMIILYKFVWSVGGNGEFLEKGWAVALNIICLYWVAPYENLLGMEKGIFGWQGYIIICVLPFLATWAGYFAGYKGFDIFEKIRGLAYEKKDK